MREVSATEFARNFRRYSELAQLEPVAVTSDGQPAGYFVSAVEFEELQRHKRRARRSFATVDLTEAEIEAIASSRIASEHDHLNALLEE